ncbi:hypothetical protein QTP86_008384 [Hemibagrus guttatus]|nr:hypothetical protein QTP86_008384 [Hemibagrus guttatus]
MTHATASPEGRRLAYRDAGLSPDYLPAIIGFAAQRSLPVRAILPNRSQCEAKAGMELGGYTHNSNRIGGPEYLPLNTQGAPSVALPPGLRTASTDLQRRLIGFTARASKRHGNAAHGCETHGPRASFPHSPLARSRGPGKGRELADMMKRRKVDILCVQETRWKGNKARSIGAGFKLFYYGVDSKRNGVGVVLKEEFVRNVLEVKRVSDRVMSLKLEIEGVMLNVVSGYAPQVGCELEEKERFWSESEVMESIPMGERVVIGADFNGHVGEGNRGDEEVMGKFEVKERNLEGQMVVDFAKRMNMAVVNTYF